MPHIDRYRRNLGGFWCILTSSSSVSSFYHLGYMDVYFIWFSAQFNRNCHLHCCQILDTEDPPLFNLDQLAEVLLEMILQRHEVDVYMPSFNYRKLPGSKGLRNFIRWIHHLA